MKKFGAVQNGFGKWELHYVNSFHGSKNLCYDESVDLDRKKCPEHDHTTITEAECCAIALSHIAPEFMPGPMEKPKAAALKPLPPPAPEMEPEAVIEEHTAGEEAALTVIGEEPETVTSTDDLPDDIAVEMEIADDQPDDEEQENA